MQELGSIYEMYSKKVFLFLLSKTSNEQLAEELMQETFFQAVQSINSFNGDSSILTWLCGIAKNIWLKYLRTHHDNLSLDENLTGQIETPEGSEVVLWEQKQVLKLIHGLAEPMREVMYLRLVSNLSFAEIGEIVNKSETWARVTFFRGKQIIVKEIEKYE